MVMNSKKTDRTFLKSEYTSRAMDMGFCLYGNGGFPNDYSPFFKPPGILKVHVAFVLMYYILIFQLFDFHFFFFFFSKVG